jgi:hypothetical protein
MDGDEIAALLDCKQLEDLDASAPHLKHEMIGNLDGITFRLCRDDDDVGRVADLLLRSKAEAAVVVLPNGEAQGVILASDLAGLTGTG